MLPQTQNEQIGNAVSGTRIMSSRTYRFNPENGEISGLYDDQTQVMAQAIWKRLLTPRGICPIYSKEYGSDLWRMNGLPLAYVQVLLPDLIRRALCADERIQSVDQFRFSREQNGLYCQFAVQTILGQVEDGWLVQTMSAEIPTDQSSSVLS